jgi:1,4-alpha-glucan branching enzyme
VSATNEIRAAMGLDRLDGMDLAELKEMLQRAELKLKEYNLKQQDLYPRRMRVFVDILQTAETDNENLLRIDCTHEWLRSEISRVDSVWAGMDRLRNSISDQIIKALGEAEAPEERAKIIKLFVDGEWREYVNIDGKLVEHEREKLFSV